MTDMTSTGLADIVRGRRCLFITTKNIDYLRNTQELGIIGRYAEHTDVISSEKGNYISRILDVWAGIIKTLKKT